MAVIKYLTKGNSNPKGKARVYFTCHPEDFAPYFEKICNDIFKTHDPVIFYKENMSDTIDEDSLGTDIGSNNLVVIPVTERLLSEKCPAMEQDFIYAKENHIPVLPIMVQAGLDFLYPQSGFGKMQYLDACSADKSAISYENKLKKYLDTVLINDELADKIRAAFDAYIFLSYRKKDRKYANELMHIIHKSPEYRDIAIWFDEFLVPGESFEENINKILSNSKLFALLVTPNLLEEPDGNPNYVMGEEYPAARKSGIEIIPVEMVSTNKSELALKFEALPDFADPWSGEVFEQRLKNALNVALRTDSKDPLHTFLMGLAYLEGIDVEVDRPRGSELIEQAAESGLAEAMQKLSNMYEWGTGVELDYKKAVLWAEKLAELKTEQLGTETPETIETTKRLASLYCLDGNYQKALEADQRVCDLHVKLLGEEHPDSIESMRNCALMHIQLNNTNKALELQEKCYELLCKLYGNEHSEAVITLSDIGLSKGLLGEHEKALELHQKAYEAAVKIYGEESLQTLTILQNVGTEYYNLKDYDRAIEILEKVYSLYCKAVGEWHPYSLYALRNLAISYCGKEDYKNGIELSEKVYSGLLKALGPEHPHTLLALSDMPHTYYCTGQNEKYIEFAEKDYNMHLKVYGEKDIKTLKRLNFLGVAYCRCKNNKKALKILKEVYKLDCEVLGRIHPETCLVMENIASVYRRIKRPLKAALLIRKVKKCKREYNVQKLIFGKLID